MAGFEGRVIATPSGAGDTVHEQLLRRLLAAGQRTRAIGATGHALVAYWTWLRQADLQARAALVDDVRAAVDSGRTGPDAWVPVILGEHDFGLARAAAVEFLGVRPVSIERLGATVAQAHDWVARRLALNVAAVYAALLEVADEAALVSLRGLRGVLQPSERTVVFEACLATAAADLRDFLEEWRSEFD